VMDREIGRMENGDKERTEQGWPGFHAQSFASIACRLDPEKRLEYWNRILHVLARSGRTEMLEGLMPLLPWLCAVAGTRELRATAAALEDVFRWWP